MPIPNNETNLTPSERMILRAAAQKIKPIIMIGNNGVTASVMVEIQKALEAHQLIKIKMLSNDRELRMTAYTQLCKDLICHPIQTIGKIFVLFKDDGHYVPPSIAQQKMSNTIHSISRNQTKRMHIPKKQLANH